MPRLEACSVATRPIARACKEVRGRLEDGQEVAEAGVRKSGRVHVYIDIRIPSRGQKKLIGQKRDGGWRG